MGELKEYRCTIQDCRHLLFKGDFIGTVQCKCQCGVVTTIAADPPKQKPNGRDHRAFTNRLDLVKKT
jgi:hypothetical protein